MTIETISQLYSLSTKLIALILILIVTPVILRQFAERRYLVTKTAFLTLAVVTFLAILPVAYYQVLALNGTNNAWFRPYVTIANSTSLLTTAGAMFVIYKQNN